MNSQNPTDEYLLLIRGTHWSHGMSPVELQQSTTAFDFCVGSLVQRGVHRGQFSARRFRLGRSRAARSSLRNPCPGLDYRMAVEVGPVKQMRAQP